MNKIPTHMCGLKKNLVQKVPKITKFRKFRCYQNFCNCKLNQGVRKPNRTSERGDRTKLWFSKTTGSWDRTSTHVQTKAHMTSAWISKHHGSASEDMDAPCELAVELEEETTLTPPELREEKERSFGFLSPFYGFYGPGQVVAAPFIANSAYWPSQQSTPATKPIVISVKWPVEHVLSYYSSWQWQGWHL